MIKRIFLSAALATAVTSMAAGARAQPASAPRGQLLYETHCIACHSTQMHWRDQRLVTDWPGLLAQVRRWQATAHLAWSDDDIEAVAQHLNDRIYRLPRPERRAGTGAAGGG
jgi:mono/diheme cytochrome c family protein